MKIAFISSRFPYPLDKGDKLRAYYFLQELAKKNKVSLHAICSKKPSQDSIRAIEELGIETHYYHLPIWKRYIAILLAFFQNIPFQVAYFYNASIHKKIQAGISQNDLHFYQLIRTAKYASGDKQKQVIDYMDAFSKGLERRKLASRGIFRSILHIEWKRVRKFESEAYQKFSKAFIISKEDLQSLHWEEKDNALVVPNGIDLTFFAPQVVEKKYDIVFTGNLQYPPNKDAVFYLLEKILPHLLVANPDLKILIAGSSPSHKIKSYQSKNVHVSGWMNDIRDAYASSKIMLAPMRLGTGMQNKLMEAMSMKIPCITTEIAAKPLGLQDKEHVLIGDNAKNISDLCMKLLKDIALQEKLSHNAYQNLVKQYNWSTQVEKMMYQINNHK